MIITQKDEFLEERWECKSRWEVVLSDGRTVYQDDERSNSISWKNLRNYLIENPDLRITKFYIGFRDNVFNLPENADGYYFRNSVLASWGSEFEKHSFLAGYLKDGVLRVYKYELPEMRFLGEEIRNIEDSGESLIKFVEDKND